MLKNLILNLLITSLLYFCCNGQMQTITLFNNVRISYTYKTKYTDFLVSSPLGNGVSPENAWLGVGLNNNAAMVRKNIIKFFIKF